MSKAKSSKSSERLAHIEVSKTRRNDDNPRIIFRQDELNRLIDSIQVNGVLVPVSVYQDGNKYILIDGERRWRSCRKLNIKTIPAIIEPKPGKIQNILKMFMIHSLREQWDLLTIALKLRELMDLWKKEHKLEPKERELKEITGLPGGTIRRCKLLLALPKTYHDMLLRELEKPKPKQKLTEDFFIEMEKALTTVKRAMPHTIGNIDQVRRTLIKKFRDGVIDNRVHFRMLGKIARAENVDADPERAEAAVNRVFQRNDYSIEKAFHDSVESAYEERDITSRINSLIERLKDLEDNESIDDEVRTLLAQLQIETSRILGRFQS